MIPTPTTTVVFSKPARSSGQRPPMGRGARTTLPLVEELLRAAGRPMRTRQLVEAAGDRLPTSAKNPRGVVSRDICLSIRDNPASPFVRIAPGLWGLREVAYDPAVIIECIRAGRSAPGVYTARKEEA